MDKQPEITIANTPIQLIPGNIGIFCSGGADSSILLYILMKYTDNNITVFTLGNQQKDHRNITVAENVINKCQELTGRNVSNHIVKKVEKQTKEEIFNPDFLNYVDNGTLDIMYTGFTTNPPDNITENFKQESDLTVRSPNIKRPYWHRNNTVYTPFSNIDKSVIAQMYTELVVRDSLYPVTRSCEWEIGMGGTDPGLGHCGDCWWCEERIWAFSELI